MVICYHIAGSSNVIFFLSFLLCDWCCSTHLQNGELGVVELLLKRKTFVNATNHLGHTALHMAMEFGCWDVVLSLEANGADGNGH